MLHPNMQPNVLCLNTLANGSIYIDKIVWCLNHLVKSYNDKIGSSIVGHNYVTIKRLKQPPMGRSKFGMRIFSGIVDNYQHC